MSCAGVQWKVMECVDILKKLYKCDFQTVCVTLNFNVTFNFNFTEYVVFIIASFLSIVGSADQCLLNSKVLSCFSGVIMSIRSFFLFQT